MKVAVVGHVEWVEFVEVDQVPAPGPDRPRTDSWAGPAGGGAVVAVQLLKLAGACDFYTALGDDELGRRSVERLARARARRCTSQWFGRRAARSRTSTGHGERTITTIGPEAAPARAASRSTATTRVFFVAGDVEALRSARGRRASSPRRRASSRRCSRAASTSTCSSAAAPTRASATTAASTSASSASPRARAAASRTAAVRARRRLPGRSRTPTAPATRSPPRSASRSARGDALDDALAPRGARGRRRRHRKGAVLGADHPLGVDKWGIVG